jgi:hypothetical protein
MEGGGGGGGGGSGSSLLSPDEQAPSKMSEDAQHMRDNNRINDCDFDTENPPFPITNKIINSAIRSCTNIKSLVHES